MPTLHYPSVRVFCLRSREVSQTFRLHVALPPRASNEKTRFPVVYAGDANLTFEMLKGISWLLQSSGTVRRFILVGIGYPGRSPMAGALLRARDFTFPGYPRISTKGKPAFEGVLRVGRKKKDFEGGEEFQRFLSRELVPLMDDRFPTQARDRTYFGHSAAGSFGLFTLLTRPTLFRNYIVSSPGLAFHGTSSAGVRYRNYDFMTRRLREFVAAGKRIEGKRLYISVGSREQQEADIAHWRLMTSFRRFAAAMRTANIAGLNITAEVLRGETHATAWPVAFVHGLRTILPRDEHQRG